METSVFKNRNNNVVRALPYLKAVFLLNCIFAVTGLEHARADSSNKIPASQIVVKNSKLGLNSTRGSLTLQDLLGRLHKPARAYFGASGDSASQNSSGLPARTWSGGNVGHMAKLLCENPKTPQKSATELVLRQLTH